MRLKDARPGQRLRDAEGAEWMRLERGALMLDDDGDPDDTYGERALDGANERHGPFMVIDAEQPTPAPTVRVRIAVAVATDGSKRWNALGYSGLDDARASNYALEGLETDGLVHWVVADVPLPQPQTIEGEVTR